MATVTERKPWNALEFGQSREDDTREGVAPAEGLITVPPNCSEVGSPQEELNGTVGEVLLLNPPPQCPRTKLFFDIEIDDPFLD